METHRMFSKLSKKVLKAYKTKAYEQRTGMANGKWQ